MSCGQRCCNYFCGETKACVKTSTCILTSLTVGLVLTTLFVGYLPKLPDAQNELAAICSLQSLTINSTTVCNKYVYRSGSKYSGNSGHYETVQVPCWKMNLVWSVRFRSDGTRSYPQVANFPQHAELECSQSCQHPSLDWGILAASTSPAYHPDTEAIQVAEFHTGSLLDCWYLPRLSVVSFTSWGSDLTAPLWGMIVVGLLGGGGLAIMAAMAIHLWIKPCWDDKPIDTRPRPRDQNGNVIPSTSI
jgi:hypothetical protein